MSLVASLRQNPRGQILQEGTTTTANCRRRRRRRRWRRRHSDFGHCRRRGEERRISRCRAGDEAIPAPVHRGAWCGCGGGLQCPTPRFRALTRCAIGPQSRRSLPPPLPPPFGNQSGRGIGRDRSSTSRGDTIRPGGGADRPPLAFPPGASAGLRREGPARDRGAGLRGPGLHPHHGLQQHDRTPRQITTTASMRAAKDTIKIFTRNGFPPPPSKLVLGVPAHGRRERDPGLVRAYSELVDDDNAADGGDGNGNGRCGGRDEDDRRPVRQLPGRVSIRIRRTTSARGWIRRPRRSGRGFHLGIGTG